MQEGRTVAVPVHLQDAHYVGAKRLGHGEGYQYAHDSQEGWVEQEYLPVNKSYYRPVARGFEMELKQRLEQLRGRRGNRGSAESQEHDTCRGQD